jgi:vanillate O-demethylase monooxygenase subunit
VLVGEGAWVDVLGATEVAPAEVAAVEVGDVEVAVWRTAEGVLAACDARCPHQWSHLAGAGVVDGDELVCLSHFWRFDTEGHGSKVSVKGRRDPKGDVVSYAVREVDGRIELRLPGPA